MLGMPLARGWEAPPAPCWGLGVEKLVVQGGRCGMDGRGLACAGAAWYSGLPVAKHLPPLLSLSPGNSGR